MGLFEADLRIHTRLIALERRLAELEERRAMSYRGIWSQDEHYSEGDYCTHAGSLWHANEGTRSHPGRDASWQLCVKRSRA